MINRYVSACAVTILMLLFSAQPARADCTNPAKPEGFILYNQDNHVQQYCNGISWVAIGSLSGPTTAACPFMSGVCPASSTGQNGCISGQALSWGTVSCSTSSGVQTVIFNTPIVLGNGPPGGNGTTPAHSAAKAWCLDLGLGYTSDTLSVVAGQYYDNQTLPAPANGQFWRSRGTGSSSKATVITCTDILAIP